MEAQISFVVVGHYSRRHQAERLANMLNAHLLIDEDQHGANWNHWRAIEWASQQDCRVVILEDDAVLVNGFSEKVTAWLSRFPDELISFYLGTGRPPQYQLEIATKLIDTDRRQADYITINRLVHVVIGLPAVAPISTTAKDLTVGIGVFTTLMQSNLMVQLEAMRILSQASTHRAAWIGRP